jgi:hypothetical protein
VANKPTISDRLGGRERSFVAAAIQPVPAPGQQQPEARQRSNVEEKDQSTNARPTPDAPRTAKQKPDRPKPLFVQATFRIRPDQITLLEEIRLAIRKRGEKPPSKYDLAQEAFDLLAKKHGFKPSGPQ